MARSVVFKTIATCCVLSFIYTPSVSGQVRFEVSDVFSAVYYSETLTLKYGGWETVDLFDTPYHDRYDAHFNASGPLRVIVLDRRDVQTNNPHPRFLLDKLVSKREEVSDSRIPFEGGRCSRVQ